MQYLLNKINKITCGKFVLVMGSIFLTAYLFLNSTVFNAYFRSQTNGNKWIEANMFYSPQFLYNLLESYGQIGRAFYTKCSLSIDFIFPFQYSLFFMSFSILIFRKLLTNSIWQKTAIIFGIVLCLSDWLENIFLLVVLHSFPLKLFFLSNMAQIMTLIKGAITYLFIIVIVISGLIYLIKLARSFKSANLARINNKEKRIPKKVIAILLAVSLLFGGIYLFNGLKHKKILSELEVSSPNIAELQDGAYKGAYDGYLVSAEVTVIIKDHMIQEIIINKHENERGRGAEIIIYQVISSQSLEVDAITGATQSSKVILKAIENALSSD